MTPFKMVIGMCFTERNGLPPSPPLPSTLHPPPSTSYSRAADGLVRIQECCARPPAPHTSSCLDFKAL